MDEIGNMAGRLNIGWRRARRETSQTDRSANPMNMHYPVNRAWINISFNNAAAHWTWNPARKVHIAWLRAAPYLWIMLPGIFLSKEFGISSWKGHFPVDILSFYFTTFRSLVSNYAIKEWAILTEVENLTKSRKRSKMVTLNSPEESVEVNL